MIYQKLDNLKEYLRQLGSVAVAFSSGVDSTFLLDVASEVLGEKAIAVTATSEFFPGSESTEADEFCASKGIKQLHVSFSPLSDPAVAANPKDRCYLCKTALFTRIKELAARQGANFVVEGSNMDDLGDYRPGLRAIEELEIRSPLREAGLTKAEIRQLSKERGLATANKPSFACLASRIPYGDTITLEKLQMVEKGEEYLKDMGLYQFRVRVHGNLARIEVEPHRIGDVAARATEISEYFKEIGFAYVSLDLGGYRTGSLNEVLNIQEV